MKTRHSSSSDDDILTLRKVLLMWMRDEHGVRHTHTHTPMDEESAFGVSHTLTPAHFVYILL